MAKDLYLGLDLGTTGVKAGIFDESGAVLASARRETPLEATAPGFAEFDALAYAGTVFSCVREVVGAAAVEARAVRAVGLSSQAETFVILDGRGQPLRKAISWLDVRAEAEARELTGLLPRGQEVNAIASAAKLLWLRKHEPETMRRVRRVVLLPDYLIELLAGRAASDPCTASSTGAYDPWERCWNRPLLDACGLDAGMMPEVLDSGQPAGELMARAAGELGLSAGTLVVVGSNDQLCGALGAGNAAPGSVSAALGTALAVIRTASTAADLPPGVALLPHPASSAGRRLYGLLAYAKTCGVVLSWFRDTFAPGSSYEDIFREAAAAPIGAGGVVCLPHFSGTATPDFNASVRGAFAGLSLAHGRAHLARALAEALAFTVRENLTLLEGPARATELRVTGGGARSPVWLQIIADVTGTRVERPRILEAACLGAAELAMAATGRFQNAAEASKALYSVGQSFEPNPANQAGYDLAYQQYRRLRGSLSAAARL